MNTKYMTELICGVSDYFENLKKDNKVICPKHHIEHTGKNSYSIFIDSYLYKKTGDDKYFIRAKERALRTVSMLVQDPLYKHWIFWPGRLEGHNMSNSVIDSGACVDALSFFYENYREFLSEEEREEIEHAVKMVCDTYLVTACVSKEVPNQRLWGATGLAKAYSVFKEETWRKAVIKSIKKSLLEMWPDGTFPYHPNYERYGIFKGINDTTTYYHSRHIAFIYDALINIGEDVDGYKDGLIKATDILVAMYQRDGVKNINLETKRWYWMSDYEVASHPFDIYALLKTYEITKSKKYLYYANLSWQQLVSHQRKNGSIKASKNKKENFQCDIFWSAHTAWLTKINIQDLINGDSIIMDGEMSHFPEADIVTFGNEEYGTIIRGSKKSQNVNWGPMTGGGSLLYFANKKSCWKNKLNFSEWGGSDPFNFYIHTKKSQNIFWKENRKDLRALLYYIKVEMRASNLSGTLSRMNDFFKKIIKRNKDIASHFATNVDTIVDTKGKSVLFKLSPSNRNGQAIPNINLEREYNFEDNGINIYEKLSFNNQKVKSISYRVPSWACLESIKTKNKYKQKGEYFHFFGKNGDIEIKIKL